MIPATNPESSNTLTIEPSEEEKIQHLVQEESFARVYNLVRYFMVPTIEKESIKNRHDVKKISDACVFFVEMFEEILDYLLIDAIRNAPIFRKIFFIINDSIKNVYNLTHQEHPMSGNIVDYCTTTLERKYIPTIKNINTLHMSYMHAMYLQSYDLMIAKLNDDFLQKMQEDCREKKESFILNAKEIAYPPYQQ